MKTSLGRETHFNPGLSVRMEEDGWVEVTLRVGTNAEQLRDWLTEQLNLLNGEPD